MRTLLQRLPYNLSLAFVLAGPGIVAYLMTARTVAPKIPGRSGVKMGREGFRLGIGGEIKVEIHMAGVGPSLSILELTLYE